MPKEAVIVAASRTAVGKSGRGSLRTTRPDELAAIVIKDVLARAPQVDPASIEDVILGCAMPEAEQGMNVARIAAMRAGLPVEVAGQTVNRFCSSGLQTIALAAQQIMAGMGTTLLAGGVESMSMVPMSSNKFMANPWLAEHYPAAYTSMGITAENVARQFNISRAAQDGFALQSNQRAVAAIQAGRFKDEIAPVPVELAEVDAASGTLKKRSFLFDTDEGPRAETSLAALGKLKPVFRINGTVTAGNSSQTSDGAAVVLIMERSRAEELGLKPLVRFVGYAVGGVPPDVMGIGPVAAIPKVIKLTGLDLGDIDLIELNEAFAAQSLAVIQELGLDPEKVNVNGGAIALGHPLGCSGAKLTVQLIHEMARRHSRYGMVTMCIGGGMGAAGIFENLQ